jgi:acyl carrier protein
MARSVRPVAFRNCQLTRVAQRGYYKDNVLMNREYGDGYMMDPKDAAERVVRLIALHDNVNDPSEVELGKTFGELGLNELDMVEIYLMLEKEFDFEISEDDCEGFTTVNDVVEFIARNFYAK